MNKTLRHLLLTGIAAFICASCSKVESLFPEPFVRNDKPFSVEKVPVEGGIITLERLVNGVPSQLNPESSSLSFEVGDTLILTATPKGGYTFINWVRDGKPYSNQASYQFCLEAKDLLDGKVKYHHEARFGLDYAIQSIPSIDEVMPADLIAEMGPYLHFGDNPPRIDTFSFDVLQILHFIHNSDHPEIPYDTVAMYYRRDGEYYPNRFEFGFYGQHRQVFDSCSYKRVYKDLLPNTDLIEYANTQDSIFIMGNGNDFTIYYRQSMKRTIDPYNEMYANAMTGGLSIVRVESTIISGTVSPTSQSIQNFHWGLRIEEYSEENPAIGKTMPAIHDMFHYQEYHP
jgi:hypothetical protein